MQHLYPFVVQPQFHERVWGSHDLAPVYAQKVSGNPVGEAWLTGDACIVQNGSLAGRALGELACEFGARLVGETTRDVTRFPLLMKFLFPRDKLSIQVHPDDQTAKRAGLPSGKTECWYVLQAEPGAQIGLGLKRGTTKGEVLRAISERRLEHLLNWIDVQAGEMFYVDAGTLHAIGPGLVIMEIQQNSDTTYRLYDYGRPRELHIQQGLEAAREQTSAGKVAPGPTETSDGMIRTRLIAAPNFVVDKVRLSRTLRFQRLSHAPRSVWCIAPLRGRGQVDGKDSAPTVLSVGEALIVPASVRPFTLEPQPELEFLCSSVPAETMNGPCTASFESAEPEEGYSRLAQQESNLE